MHRSDDCQVLDIQSTVFCTQYAAQMPACPMHSSQATFNSTVQRWPSAADMLINSEGAAKAWNYVLSICRTSIPEFWPGEILEAHAGCSRS